MNDITAETFSQQVDQLYYPNKKDFRVYHVYHKGTVVLSNASKDELETFYYNRYKNDGDCYPFLFNEKKKRLEVQDGHIIEEDFDLVRYKKLVSDYYVAKNKIENDFRNYLYNKFDVVDNPNNLKCFELARSYGHSNGYSEVEIYFEEFVELIK